MKSNISKVIVCIFVIIIGLSSMVMAYRPSEQTLTIGDNYGYDQAPHFYGVFDAAGFSDGIYWGYEPNHHPYSYHEVLSGEYGSAIFYDDISTEPNAMWLTNQFLFPNWTTNSDFDSFGASAWYDSSNPVPNNNTGQSVIENDQVRVTIDYEVVDLGDGNSSPLSVRDANGQTGFVKSFQYLFLQTYTITNLQNSSNITGLEFYQMLC